MDRYQRNELRETVERYKNYTDWFQQWLMKTAVQRRVENAAQIAAQAKALRKQNGKKAYNLSNREQALLVDGIASSSAPLKDTSGLRDLQDAIRSRKEVAQYHKATGAPDSGHDFFNYTLENAQTKLTRLVATIPVQLKSQDLEDEASTFMTLQFYADEPEDSDREAAKLKAQLLKAETQQETIGQNMRTTLKGTKITNTLSKQDAELQRNFLVLSFLYELNRVRHIVREIWVLYHQGSVTSITAALVTDFVQGYVQQNVSALVEELALYDSQLTLIEIIRQIYTELSRNNTLAVGTSTPSQLPDTALRHLLCMEAIDNVIAHAESAVSGSSSKSGPELPFIPFLQHFEAIRNGKVTVPMWDKFTESIVRRTANTGEYLPFGLQIIVDVHTIMRKPNLKILRDITDHGLDITRLIQAHSDYEDHMWNVNMKPDYMSLGNEKFSNVYLASMDAQLKWIKVLLNADHPLGQGVGMNNDLFVAMHSTLAGISMYKFNKTYYAFSISKVKWFIVVLVHLYNAALKIGGLEQRWPDLDFIIEMHGPERLFVGGPPDNQDDFLERYLMSTCVSSRIMAKDYTSTAKYYPRTTPELKKLRGLATYFPLEDVIAKYYGPDKNEDRWLKRHAVFNLLHKMTASRLQELQAGTSDTDEQWLTKLRDMFALLAKKISRSKSKSKSKNRKESPVSAPDFSKTDDKYANLFRTMMKELQSHELHSHFDFLTFYRRAHGVIRKIRNEVLFDDASQLARHGDMHMDPNPSNGTLLVELFRALKRQPKSGAKKSATTVVALDKFKRIAGMLEEVILKDGGLELNRAKMRLNGKWDDLKASYGEGREEDGDSASRPDPADQPHSPPQPDIHNVPNLDKPLAPPDVRGVKRKHEVDDSVLYRSTLTAQDEQLGDTEWVELETQHGIKKHYNPKGIFHRLTVSKST
jgi:hypothetical protein